MNDSSSIFEIIYETTRTSENRLNIKDLCNMAGVSRSGYYAWLNAAPLRAAREERDRRDFDLILCAYNMDGYPKGAREIHMTLLHMTPPVIMNRKKVLRLMNKYNLICPVRKLNPRRQLMRDMQTGNVVANLLKRRFEEFGPRTVLLTDITYLPYNGIFAYLSTILDAFTKQVLAYAVSASLEIDFVLDTVKALLRDHPVALNTITIIHSDQGSHYTSHDFIDLLRKSDLRRSMSRRGNCWDNAPQESFFGHMKDCIRDRLAAAASFEEVKAIIDDYIDYYNNRRYQWDLAKLSPNEFYNFVTTGKYPLDVPYVPAPPEITRDPCELAVDAIIGSLFGQIP